MKFLVAANALEQKESLLYFAFTFRQPETIVKEIP